MNDSNSAIKLSITANSGTFLFTMIFAYCSQTIFEIAHRNQNNTVFWHIDGVLVGATRNIHELGVSPEKGKHMLTITDNVGETMNIPFEVMSEKR